MNKNRVNINNKFFLYVIRILVWIPPILIAMFIFGFSSQGGEESSGLSEKAARVILHVADNLHIVEVTSENEAQLIENLQTPIRKAAHMTEYIIFTLSVYFALYIWNIRFKMRLIIALIIAILFACTDEFHQLFVEGRNGNVIDVLIDSIGAIIGLSILGIKNRRGLLCLNKKTKGRKAQV